MPFAVLGCTATEARAIGTREEQVQGRTDTTCRCVCVSRGGRREPGPCTTCPASGVGFLLSALGSQAGVTLKVVGVSWQEGALPTHCAQRADTHWTGS